MAILSIMGMYNYDQSIFDGLTVPEGMDKETVINNILLNCAELEIIYSKNDIMKLAISVWSDSNQISWNKLYNTMTVEYNPLWNVDADIEEIGSGNRQNSGTSVDAVQGFNSTSWADANKNTVNANDDFSDSRHIRRTGNIGVTSSQQLIEAERKVADFNMVEFITESFKNRFCLMIY